MHTRMRSVDHGALDPVFLDKAGQRIRAMPADYGFRSGAGRLNEERYGDVPDNVWELVRGQSASPRSTLGGQLLNGLQRSGGLCC